MKQQQQEQQEQQEALALEEVQEPREVEKKKPAAKAKPARKAAAKQRKKVVEQAPMDNTQQWLSQWDALMLYGERSGYGQTSWRAMEKLEPGLFRNHKITETNLSEFWKRHPNFKREG